MFWHYSMEGKTGIRSWWHFASRSVFRVEFYWWTRHCHASVDVDDEGWTWAIALPPLSIYISFDGFKAWKPMRKCIATWDGNREFWLTDQRTCAIKIHGWTIWIQPWSKSMEWCRADPWWVRGVSLNLQDLVLGRTRYTCESLGPAIDVSIPMPEGMYRAVFTPQRQTWKRPRGFTQVRDSFDIKIPKGIPFAGKGENSWDCGDDGLFGMGAEGTIHDAIARVRETVMERRRRYGSASDEAIREALA